MDRLSEPAQKTARGRLADSGRVHYQIVTSKRLMLVAGEIACVIAGAALWGPNPLLVGRSRTPLWPSAKYTIQDRDRAVEQGLRFIYSIANDQADFRDNGSDLLFAFQNIATSNGTPRLAALASSMGHERAIEWRRQHQQIPRNAGAQTIWDLLYGSDTADRLGVADPAFDQAPRVQAARFSPTDYLGFDPAREPPPDDLPLPCRVCGLENARGAQVCARCGTKLSMYSRQALFMDALVETYFGELFGAPPVGRHSDVLRWLPHMRPYPPHRYGDWGYYDAIYAVTHVVYTFNRYNLSRIAPGCFPAEFAYLKENLPAAIQDHDPETLGEYVDSLRAFGMTYSDAGLREATEYLLSVQNRDGSWGEVSDKESYNRYHTTWTGLGAIQDFRWTQELTCTAEGQVRTAPN
jgi:hypothetical protein